MVEAILKAALLIVRAKLAEETKKSSRKIVSAILDC